MKWFTHEVVAGGAAFVLGMPPAALVGVLAGSILPDVMDQRFSGLFRNRQKVFNRIHRGVTHWFGWWFGLWILGLSPLPDAWPPVRSLLAGFGFGGLCHVLLDLCTVAGVPVFPWARNVRVSLQLCRTGGIGEYLFLVLCAGLFFILKRNDLLEIVERVRQVLSI